MNQKRLMGIICMVLAAFLLFPRVSAEETPHREHSVCKAIRTEEDLLQLRSGDCGYLEADITLSETMHIEGEITLCLNGKVLRYEKDEGSIFRIGKEGTLRICDCSEEIRFYGKEENGLWSLSESEGGELTGGAILGGKGEKQETGELERVYLCGGFAYIDGGTLILWGGNIIGNSADFGGAVYLTGDGRFEMRGGKLGGNLASVRGGGVFIQSGEMLLEAGSVFGNRSEKNGGGIGVSAAGALEIRGGFVTGNAAGAYGGGIENFGNLEMRGATVSENSAAEDAGGVYNGGVFAMYGGSLRENSAKYGGGVCNDGKMTLHDGVIQSNLAQASGGGIYNADTLVINNGVIVANTAGTSGGGIENDGICTMYGGTVGGSTAESANAAHLGGGVCVYSGSFTMYGGSICGNTAVDGGGVENEAVFSMQGGTVTYNYAALQGGGITNRGTLSLSGDASVTVNASGTSEKNEHAGGGIYWVVEENTSVCISDSVRVTENKTNGKNANLVLFGNGTVSVLRLQDSMRVGLTLLDRNKNAVSGVAARLVRAQDIETASAVFEADTEDFSLQTEDTAVRLSKKSGTVPIFVALIAVCAVGGGIAFFAVRNRHKSGRFKKNV